MRVGIADHLGWAVAVTASGRDVTDRRRIELVAPDVPPMPVHHGIEMLDDAAAVALIESVRASIRQTAAAELDALAAALPRPIESISLRTWSPDFPSDIATQRKVPWESRADAVMYRQELAELARARGWEVCLFEAKTVIALATGRLGVKADEVLQGPRARLGPPWTADHRLALAAAITAD